MAEHIFISYSKKNRAYATSLAEFLRQQGFDVWIDDRIDYGTSWERVIFRAIDQAGAFVVIMTPQSYESEWVLRECQYAEKRGKPQFPLLLDGEEFPRYVSTQYADVRGGTMPDEELIGLLAQAVPRKPVTGEDVTKALTQEIETVLATSEIPETTPPPATSPAQTGSKLPLVLIPVVIIALIIVAVIASQGLPQVASQPSATPSDTSTATPTPTPTDAPSATPSSQTTPSITRTRFSFPDSIGVIGTSVFSQDIGQLFIPTQAANLIISDLLLQQSVTCSTSWFFGDENAPEGLGCPDGEAVEVTAVFQGFQATDTGILVHILDADADASAVLIMNGGTFVSYTLPQNWPSEVPDYAAGQPVNTLVSLPGQICPVPVYAPIYAAYNIALPGDIIGCPTETRTDGQGLIQNAGDITFVLLPDDHFYELNTRLNTWRRFHLGDTIDS